MRLCKEFFLLIMMLCLHFSGIPLGEFNTSIQAQTQTLILQPGPTDGTDASMRTDHPDINYGTDQDFIANTWTVQGNFFIMRSLIQFDLTSIPSNSIVITASLFLSTDLTSGHHQLNSGLNTSYLYRVVESWAENQVTWNTQPAFSMSNPVILPVSVSDTAHYEVDVKSHVQDMVSNPSANFGWLFKLQTEALYRCMVFASSDNTVPAWRPELTVVFCPIPGSTSMILGPDNVCQGDTGKIYSVLPVPYASNYSWSLPPGATIAGGAGTNIITVSFSMNAVSGPISVYPYDSCGAGPASPPFPVTVNPIPVPALTGPPSVCLGATGNIYYTDAGKTNYLWNVSPGGTITAGGSVSDSNIVVTWTSPGTGYVSVNYTNATGCSSVNPTTLQADVKTLPVPSITGTDTACVFSTGNTYATEPGMTAYAWGVSAGGIITSGFGTNSVTIEWITAGPQSVSILYTDQFGCTAAEPSSFPVNVKPLPEPAGIVNGPSPVCAGAEMVVYSVAPVANASSYIWTLPPGFSIVSGFATNMVTVSVSANCPGGNIMVHANNHCGNGLPSPPYPVIVNSPPSGNAGPDGLTCQNTPFKVSHSFASNYSVIHWHSNGPGLLTDTMTLSPTYIPAPGEIGQVKLTMVVSGLLPCGMDTSVMILDIQPIATVLAGSDLNTCGQTPVIITGSSATDFQTLFWTTSGSGSFNDSFILHPAYSPSDSDFTAGIVRLILHATSSEPCEAVTDSVLLTLNKKPVVNPGPDGTICQTMTFPVAGVTASDFSSFTWVHDGTGILSRTNTLSPVYTPGTAETGNVTITLKVFGQFSCKDEIAFGHMNVGIFTPVKVNAGADLSIAYNTSATLMAEVSGGTGNNAYHWEPSSLVENDTTGATQTVSLENDTVLIITVTDKVTGCSTSDSIKISVGQGEDPEHCINIYNVITPNGDGMNDTWIIDCIDLFPENSVEIFNRWGDRVTSYNGYNNTTRVWNGKNQDGNLLPDGTYFYIVKINNGQTFKGWVFLRSGL
ncbi:MAG: gliding motility-associated C-terminal domain-containing protein [Bacteroidota bacterium]